MLKKLLLVGVILLQGCSVYMAADGTKEPNISHFNDGMSRFQVESVLGAPISYTKTKDGSKAIYEFEVGNEPDSGRAALWLVADIFLIFLPELIGTPYEMNKGEMKKILVVYDENDNVIKLEN
jgi:hypothetical protein